jgi:hypothetical protein
MPRRGNTTDAGYGYQHQQHRLLITKPLVDTGQAICYRCGNYIDPQEPWDDGHNDDDRTVYMGPEHRYCNRSAAAHKRNTTHKPWRRRTHNASQDW